MIIGKNPLACVLTIVVVLQPHTMASESLATDAGADEPFEALLAWLRDNIHVPLSVADLARRTAMSPRNFARRFRERTGITPARHIENLRLAAVQRHLASTSASLEEVAAATGFGDPEVLRRAFKRRMGIAPSRYRRAFADYNNARSGDGFFKADVALRSFC